MTSEPQLEVDVAVVGGGACGLMAALRAARNPDLTVAVFEKSTREGCNAEISSGSLAAGGTRFQRAAGVEDSPELHAAEILAASGDQRSAELVRALCAVAPTYVEWLADELDYPMELGTDMPRAGMSVPRLHTDTGRLGGRRLINRLRAEVNRGTNLALVDESPAIALLTDDDGVHGTVVRQNGERIEVRARHTVLATDGFAGNAALMAEYCPELTGAFYGGTSTSTGDAVPWLRELDVELANMGSCLRHGQVVVGHGTRVNPALPFLGAVLLDAQGRRFVDERAQGYSGLASVLQRQPGERALMVWDEPAMAAAAESELMRESVRAGAIDHHATEADLCSAYGLVPEQVRKALDDAAAGRRLAPPYYAARVTHGVLTTQGGAVVDVAGRPLTRGGIAVPGLRAGGGTAVGLAGPTSSGYSSGNGLLAACGMGWLIGESLAREPRCR